MSVKKSSLTRAEVTDLVIANLAYDDPGQIESYGAVDGFQYDRDLSDEVLKRLENSGIDYERVGFHGAIFTNPDTGEWKIGYAGTEITGGQLTTDLG